MANIRALAESDLSTSLEGDYGLPVNLIDPDGVIYDKSANDPNADLVGQVLYDTLVDDPTTGAEIIVHKPVVTLRRSSLERVPAPGEKWAVKIPLTPNPAANKKTFFLERPSESGGAIGFIRLYLMEAEQES